MGEALLILINSTKAAGDRCGAAGKTLSAGNGGNKSGRVPPGDNSAEACHLRLVPRPPACQAGLSFSRCQGGSLLCGDSRAARQRLRAGRVMRSEAAAVKPPCLLEVNI